MFEIKVCSLDQAEYYRADWATRTVSLLDRKMTGQVPLGEDRLVLHFSDVTSPFASQTPPMEIHVEKVLDFTKDLKPEDKLLVHCHMGVSRSTAMAIAVLCQHGMSPKDALSHILDIRPVAWPNSLIISYADKVLGLKGELMRVVKEFLTAEQKKLLFVQEEEKVAQVNHMKGLMGKLGGLLDD